MATLAAPFARLTVVTGPAGIGKTTAIRRALDDVDHVWITSRGETHASELAARLLRRLRIRLADMPVELAGAVGPLYGPSAPDDAASRAEHLGVLFGRALDRRLDHPLVIVFDEVDRLAGSPGPIRLIESLTRSSPAHVSMILATRSKLPMSVARLDEHGSVAEIDAADLRIDDVAALDIAQGVTNARDLCADIVRLGQGNPSTIRRLAALVECSAPERRRDHLRELATAPQPTVELLDRLLAHVSVGEHAVLHDLVMLGVAAPGDLEAIGHRLDGLRLDFLAAADLLAPIDGGHRFVPTRAVQERLALDPDRVESMAGVAVSLAVQAGNPRRGLAIAMTSHSQADLAGVLAELGERVVEQGSPQLVLDAWTRLGDRDRDRLAGSAGQACEALGDWDQAVARYEQSSRVQQTAAVAWRHGMLEYLRGDNVRAREIYEQALAELDATDTSDAEIATLRAFASSAAWLAADIDRARELSRSALAAATTSGSDQALAAAYTAAALVDVFDGDRIGNEWNYVRALQHAERAADALQIARIRCNRGSRLMEEGEYEAALAELDIAVRYAEIGSFRPILALSLTNRGEVLVHLGRLDDARTDLTVAVELFQSQRSRFVGYPLVVLARLFVVRGDIEQARGASERGLRLLEAADDQQKVVSARVQLALALADRDPAAARAAAEAATQGPSGSLDLAEAWVTLASIEQRAGRIETAQAAADRAAELARTRRDRFALAAALEVQAVVGPAPAAASRLEEARAIFAELGCQIDTLRVDLALARRLDSSHAAALIRAVGDRASRLGARPLANAAAELGRLAVRPNDRLLDVSVLGAFGLVRRSEPVPLTTWQSKKARDLFKMLVTRRGRPLTRDEAMERLWPDDPIEKLSSRLSVALATAKSVLDPDKDYDSEHFIVSDNDSMRLNTSTVTVDVERFLDVATDGLLRVRHGDADAGTAMLANAEAMYTGDVLEDDPYVDWHVGLREEARAAYLAVAAALADIRISDGDHDDAVRLLLRLLEREPYDEVAHLRLVTVLAQSGRHGEARRRYQFYADRMRELDIEPQSFPADDHPNAT